VSTEGHSSKELTLLLSHCLLNQKTRAGRAYTPRVTQKLLEILSRYPVWLEQLPCPEFSFVGEREKKPKDAWEKLEGFREHCSNLADEIRERIKKLPGADTSLLLVSIARSPSCSSGQVYWGNRVIQAKGILVEELEKRIKLNLLEFDFRRVSWSLERMEKYLKALGEL
jgi:predicted secreted protein